MKGGMRGHGKKARKTNGCTFGCFFAGLARGSRSACLVLCLLKVRLVSSSVPRWACAKLKRSAAFVGSVTSAETRMHDGVGVGRLFG